MAILVIEDDPKTGDYLKKGLRESGYTVDLARTGTDGLHMAMEQNYDLVVLDVMLPGTDGWQVMSALRANACRWRSLLCMTACAPTACACAGSRRWRTWATTTTPSRSSPPMS